MEEKTIPEQTVSLDFEEEALKSETAMQQRGELTAEEEVDDGE